MMVKKRVAKWGNSLAIRIPKAFAVQIGLEEDSPVELSLDNGELVVAPTRKAKPELEQLLAEVSEENLHDEIRTGPPVGREVW
jgi:antitoxin MazE